MQLLAHTGALSSKLNLHVRDFSGPVLTNGNRANPSDDRFSVPSLADRADDLLQLGGSLTEDYTLPSGVLLTSISSVEKSSIASSSAAMPCRTSPAALTAASR